MLRLESFLSCGLSINALMKHEAAQMHETVSVRKSLIIETQASAEHRLDVLPIYRVALAWVQRSRSPIYIESDSYMRRAGVAGNSTLIAYRRHGHAIWAK